METLHESQRWKKIVIDHWRQHRHDLLNQIQLVKSYLQLERLHDAHLYLDQIVVRARQEALLSRLGDPDLAYDLMTYNYQSRPFELDLEMALDEEDLDQIGKEYNWLELLKKLMELFESVYVPADRVERQSLFLLVARDGEHLLMKGEWRGKWERQKGEGKILALRERVDLEQGKLVEQLGEELLCLDIRLPWPVVQPGSP